MPRHGRSGKQEGKTGRLERRGPPRDSGMPSSGALMSGCIPPIAASKGCRFVFLFCEWCGFREEEIVRGDPSSLPEKKNYSTGRVVFTVKPFVMMARYTIPMITQTNPISFAKMSRLYQIAPVRRNPIAGMTAIFGVPSIVTYR